MTYPNQILKKKLCLRCGLEYSPTSPCQKYCASCGVINEKEKEKEHNQRPKVKKRKKEYSQRPEVKRRRKEYYQERKEELKRKGRGYYHRNKGNPKYKLKKRKYYQKNILKFMEKNKKYREDNPEKVKEDKKKWELEKNKIANKKCKECGKLLSYRTKGNYCKKHIIKYCERCSLEFTLNSSSQKYCSKCKIIHIKERSKEYSQRPEVKKRYKEWDKKRSKSPKRKKYGKEYNQRPKVKKRKKESWKK